MIISSVSILLLLIVFIYFHREIRSLRAENEDLRELIEEYSADNFATLQEEINMTRAEVAENNFYFALYYFDFCNYLHKTWHLYEDEKGYHYPGKYQFTLDEELRLLNLKKQIDEECQRRGWPSRPMSVLEGL